MAEVNKGLSKYRKGFPVKLNEHHWLALRITHAWLKHNDASSPELDKLVTLLPKSGTFRVRGDDVPHLILLLERGADLPFGAACGVFYERRSHLVKLSTMDLMVDAQRG